MLSVAQHLLPWWEIPVAVIDFESTGVNPKECMPVEMAVVRFEKGVSVDRWSTLINPGIPIPMEAYLIHGITDAMVADAPTMEALASTISDLAIFEDTAPCAYNAPFDRTILHRFAGSAYACEHPTSEMWPWLDPLVAVRLIDRYVSGKGRHKLTAACERRSITIDGAHRALADAEACGRLLFSDDIRELLSDMTISEVLRRQVKRAADHEQDFQAWKAKQSAVAE